MWIELRIDLFLRSMNACFCFQSGGGSIFGGISICFPQTSSFEQHDHIRNRSWSIDYGPDLDQEEFNNTESSVNLFYKSSDKDSRIWPCRYVDMRNVVCLS